MMKIPDWLKTFSMETIRSVKEINWEEWVPGVRAVIVYIHQNNQVLLIHKKRGLGAGKVNAPGGHIEAGETPEQAAVRECQEEVGLTPKGLELRGKLYFQFLDGLRMEGFVYTATAFTGDMIETDEADPFWCHVDKMPLNRMWEDDFYWLPQVLRGKQMDGRFIFDNDTMVSLDVAIRDPE
ncbi:mutT family protein, putative 78-dihydro-8-oxoguanine triphosphatase (8-oxo-dGTPase) [Desulforapulum autotrophicum HRM2]|uniref:Oxidized purine nucleoside triphosphate hydrolase n=2 Tax=Desulforapulum autotrophicum TaxID=2296 RepID=C0QFC1_DESAH|nr:mutT family protein, putative 78-dihydro-8-oxoguanine triphosphatase (8-oxo-dGTPase) [Desulforapulum autotrophicum HRM2]